MGTLVQGSILRVAVHKLLPYLYLPAVVVIPNTGSSPSDKGWVDAIYINTLPNNFWPKKWVAG